MQVPESRFGITVFFVAVAVQPSGCGAPGVSFPVMLHQLKISTI